MFHFDGDKNAHEFRIKGIEQQKKNTFPEMKRNHAQRGMRRHRQRQRERDIECNRRRRRRDHWA